MGSSVPAGILDEGGETLDFLVHLVGDLSVTAEEGEFDILVGHGAPALLGGGVIFFVFLDNITNIEPISSLE